MARAMPILSAIPRYFSFRNDPAKCAGAGRMSALHGGCAPARFDKKEFFVEADLVAYAETSIEVEQIDAAAQEHVLAVIHHLAFFADRPGCGAAAQESAGFVKIDFETGTAQRRGRGEPGQSTSDNGYAKAFSYTPGIRMISSSAMAYTLSPRSGCISALPQNDPKAGSVPTFGVKPEAGQRGALHAAAAQADGRVGVTRQRVALIRDSFG